MGESGAPSEGGRRDVRRLGGGADGAADAGCVNGAACGDGGTCAGGACCAAASACGASCCAGGSICSFNKCVARGNTCYDSTDCDGGYCQYPVASADAGAREDASAHGDASACVGATLPRGVCLAAPPACPDSGAGAGVSCIETCDYHPEAGTFAPVLKYSWGGDITTPFSSDVMMAPVVVPMFDTNCDGKVNQLDIPDIVFTTFTGGVYNHQGIVHAVRVRDGKLQEDWNVPVAEYGSSGTVDPGFQIAGGDLDGVGGAEIVACLSADAPSGMGVNTYTGGDGVVAFHTDGSVYWVANGVACYMPSIADLNGDGKPEVIVEGGIVNGQTGAITPYTSAAGTALASIGYATPVDLDGDGKLEVVSGEGAWHSDGTRFIDTGGGGGFVGIGDLDKDGTPEVVVVGDTFISVWHYQAAAPYFTYLVEKVSTKIPVPMGQCASSGGGPPTIADFNGDGYPDVALAGSINYTVFDGYKLTHVTEAPEAGVLPGGAYFLWTYSPTDDCSSAETGSTVFDFTGSGIADVLYSDQQKLRVFNGPDGAVLWQTCNTTGTLVEYPIVADVDNDGHADIVVVSNAYAASDPEVACAQDGGPSAQSGVRVFSNLSWVPTRALWNEHAYHITNVNDDGTIPTAELPNWLQSGFNDFRQNKQPGDLFAAPDPRVSVAPACGSPVVLVATVRNVGEAALPSGVQVNFYAGSPPDGTLLGSANTTLALYSAQSQSVTLAAPTAMPGNFYAIVDPPGEPPHPAWHSCRTGDNSSATATITTTCGSGPK